MGKFVHLHVHTQYSLLDGAADIKGLIAAVKANGMSAVAITDHGVMYGVLKFYREAIEQGIKPIIGCEVYVAPRLHTDKTPKTDENSAHLVLLAENLTGYRNLLKLVSKAQIDGFYYRPRVDVELLREYSAGLIALSACMSGEIPQLLLKNEPEKARETALRYKEIFGVDNFFLELQFQRLEGQRELNRKLSQLADECGLGIVATNDVHYLKRDDALAHDVLLCIQTGKNLNDTNRMKFPNADFYLKTPAEMADSFAAYPEALANTVKIAERCCVELPTGEFHMPKFDVPDNKTAADYLRELCLSGVERRKISWNDAYEQRLEHELQVIQSMGFCGYFLIVWDFVSYAREHGIATGPGRGSAAGSLVAYLLGITNLDPIRNDLLFERFLNPERISMPDIDIDFCFERRGEVIDYVRRRYGSDRVAQIITFGTLAARAVVKDVGRVLGLPYGDVDRLSKLIPRELGISLQEAINQSPEIKQLINGNFELQRLIDIAQSIEGFPRHASTHAAGVVIAGEPLTDYLPLSLSNEDEIVTQFTMEDIEYLGLLKMDFLGLRTLTVLRDTINLIKENRNLSVDLETIPLGDKATFNELQNGRTLGVFQLESRGIRALMMHLLPDCLADLTALVAMYRPGPLGSGMVDDYIRTKHGQQAMKCLHPLLEPILRETNGVILYQEQVMRIVNVMGGFSLGEADLVRRAMSKKKPEVLAKMREKFVAGAIEKAVDVATANEIFKLLEYFSGYGFNKSHSAAYALVAYQTAYFKVNYPQEYLAALLTANGGYMEKTALYVGECRRMGIRILPPDVNHSTATFRPEGSAIRFGLAGVKNIGFGAIDKITAERAANGQYTSLEDFCARVSNQMVNKRVVESLINSGAFDFSGKTRSQMLSWLNEFFDLRRGSANQLNLLGEAIVDNSEESIVDFSPRELLEQEKEYLGVYISGHPLDEWEEKFRQNKVTPIAELDEESEGKEVLLGGLVTHRKEIRTKKGAMMASFRLEDLTGSLEMVVFPVLYGQISVGYYEEAIAVVKGKVEQQERGLKLLVSQLRWLTKATSETSRQ